MMNRMMTVVIGVVSVASFCHAGESNGVKKISDNSFLIEEAYNQEPGVIQHINTYQYNHEDHSWLYTFTEEWPVPDETHQLSFMLPVAKVQGDSGSDTGLGDMYLNYRYQLLGGGRTAIAPRFSLIVPTGDSKKGLGKNDVGYQAALPVSIDINDFWTMHLNGGLTYYDGAEDAAGHTDNTFGYFYGASAIACVTPSFNLMLEFVGGSDQSVVADNMSERSDWMFINPGVRFAINCKHDLQIVPGLSFPIGVGPSDGETAVFFYLSFEHPAF